MRIVMWDLETTDLAAMMGRILCCSLKELGKDVETLRADSKGFKLKDKIDDRELVRTIKDRLENANMIVGWNSKLFDLPMLNARLAKAGLSPCQPQLHLDLMWYAGGSSMRIGSKKLVNVQKFFGLGEEKTEISWEQWQRAAALDKAAMDEVVLHCEQDVKVLEQAYWKLIGSVRNIHR